MYNKTWGYGSVGRALRSHRKGQRFESAYLHQNKNSVAKQLSFYNREY